MVDTRRYSGPFPTMRFSQQVADVAMPPLVGSISGELTATKNGMPLGIARFPGEVVAVHLACKSCGADADGTLYWEANVKINGTSVLTTKPRISTTAETAQHKTTYPEAADTLITQAVLNKSNTRFVAGDVFDWDFIYSGSGVDANIRDPMVIVELRPD